MTYIVLFQDSPTADPDIRKTLMPQHLAFLESHSDCVQSAGPLHTPTGEGAGGLWIVEAADVAAVEQLVQSDPFWPTGLRESYAIRVWTQVFNAAAPR